VQLPSSVSALSPYDRQIGVRSGGWRDAASLLRVSAAPANVAVGRYAAHPEIHREEATPGKRDFAIILLLATFGLGAAEVLALRLEDLDWKNSVF
jgi:integrase